MRGIFIVWYFNHDDDDDDERIVRWIDGEGIIWTLNTAQRIQPNPIKWISICIFAIHMHIYSTQLVVITRQIVLWRTPFRRWVVCTNTMSSLLMMEVEIVEFQRNMVVNHVHTKRQHRGERVRLRASIVKWNCWHTIEFTGERVKNHFSKHKKCVCVLWIVSMGNGKRWQDEAVSSSTQQRHQFPFFVIVLSVSTETNK